MIQNKKVIEYAKKMKLARAAGDDENVLFFFVKILATIKKEREKSLIDERKNDYVLSHFYE